MNTCNSIKELILTDYLDSHASPAVRRQIDDHMMVCLDCRFFAQNAKEKLVVPFENTPQQTVPDHVWLSIKERIENETPGNVQSESLISKVVQFFTIPNLVPVLGGLVIVIVVSALFFQKQQMRQVKAREQVEYLAHLFESPVIIKESAKSVSQTPIEQYFL